MSSICWVFSSKTCLPWCRITQFLPKPSKTHPAQPWTLAPEPGALPWAMWDHGVRECCKPSQKMMFMSNYLKSYHLGEVIWGVSNLWSDPDLPYATLIKQLVRWHHHALPPTFLVQQNGPEKGKEIMFASLVYDALFLMKRSNENISNMSPKKRGPLSKGKDSVNHYFLGENC